MLRLTRCSIAILVLVVVSVSAQAGEIVVGSFNMEWFGTGMKPRSQEQIKTVAKYIRSLEVDVLAVQEVSKKGDKSGNGDADWNDLLTELGSKYDGKLGDTGLSQRLGFIWRNDRVDLTDFGELKGIV